jgi:RNA polymerase sigma-70 factor (ECF subfamily)
MYPEELALGNYDRAENAVAATPFAKRPGEVSAEDRERLLERIRTDSAALFDEIFEQYQSMVYQLAFRILGEREEALDVSQEVFLTIYRKIYRFRAESSLKTWIYRIAVNRASNRCRWWNCLRRRGTVSLDEHLSKESDFSVAEVLQSRGESPEAALLHQERYAEIERSLLRLPIHQRIAVIMRDVEGMSYEEIAESTSASLGTVKSRISRGREELKRHLNGALSSSGKTAEVL